MKKIFTIVLSIVLVATIWAQSPEKMSYQAIIRDAESHLVVNRNIGIQISILQGDDIATATAVYIETHTVSTNQNGLVTLEIGTGSIITGLFSDIDWSVGQYFIKTETDINGGNEYSITGTSQLLSVPYALHAKTAESLTGSITENDPNFTAWDRSTGISITESQVSDLGTYLEAENDPQFSGSVASSISSDDISNWNSKLSTEVDGSTTNELQVLSISGDTIYLTDGGFVKLPAGASFSGSFNDLSDVPSTLDTDDTDDFDGDFTSLTNIPADLADGDDDTHLTETEVDNFVSNNGYLTTEVDGSISNEIELPTQTAHSGEFLYTDGNNPFWGAVSYNNLSDIPADLADGDDDTQLTESEVDTYVSNNGYLTAEVDGSVTNEIELPTQTAHSGEVLYTNGNDPYWGAMSYNNLSDIPADLADGDNDTQLTETEVDAYVSNNGYLTAEVDGSVTNEIELPDQSGNNGLFLATNGANPYWASPSLDPVRTITSNTVLANTDEVVFINGPYTATMPVSPPDGKKIVVCTNNGSAGIAVSSGTISIVLSTYTSLTFSAAGTNIYTLYYSSSLNTWLAKY